MLSFNRYRITLLVGWDPEVVIPINVRSNYEKTLHLLKLNNFRSLLAMKIALGDMSTHLPLKIPNN